MTPFILSSIDSSLISSVKNADSGLPSERTNTQNRGGVRLTTNLTVVSYNRFLNLLPGFLSSVMLDL